MAHGTTVKEAIKRHGLDGAVAWADHIIETLEFNLRSERRTAYALADLILKGDLFAAREIAKLTVTIREARRADNDEWEPADGK